MVSTIVTDLFTKIDGSFLAFSTNGAARIANAARTPFNTLVTVYVLLWGLAMWRGLIQEPLSDGVLRVLKIVLIGTFALNMGVYTPRIANSIYQTPERLATIIAPGATTGGAGTSLDRALAKGVEVGAKFSDAASLWSPIDGLGLMIQALIVWVFTGALIGYATALVVLAKIGLTVVLTLGPIFIALLLFDSTKQFFSGWLAQALNGVFQYVVAVVIAFIAIAFFYDAAQSTLSEIGAVAPQFTLTLKMIVAGLAVFLALMQSGAIASALAGGVQIGTMGGVGWAAEKMRRLASAPWRTVRGGLAMNQRRHANDFYRKQLGLKPTLTTRMMNSVLHGSNQSEKK